MVLNTTQFAQYVAILEASSDALAKTKPGSMEFEVYRLAVIKGFELTLELAGKLLRKRLKEFEASPREVDALVFKDVFRLANKHGILEMDAVERWFRYRDNRNQIAHDYGQAFTQITLGLLPAYLRRESLGKHLAGQDVVINQESAPILGIEPRHWDRVSQLLREWAPQAEVWAFGSRVKGQHHSGSDLDLIPEEFRKAIEDRYVVVGGTISRNSL